MTGQPAFRTGQVATCHDSATHTAPQGSAFQVARPSCCNSSTQAPSMQSALMSDVEPPRSLTPPRSGTRPTAAADRLR
eukprot:CAMPEP_0195018418 /NCGR_PEP_ID=MMETSP0326_2-20130528/30192_1 /TAXON_ID=2866 ORGANISM="Crypthecodinium cohnii, Strain Seligo" /NCGR_SAMPLE_ID=MMETSP0326_2 /ASSEMBLY_ACC=CAM_ASM_000348 /LENGTH=77 /DNA_ID=CAMNT_0040035821 /DNA_START=479 /DNA_END=709 /DNA_ORIENTATION=+